MATNKVKIAYLQKRAERKSKYEKSQKGFVKEAQKLTRVCDAEIASVTYSPFHKEPIVFPNKQAAFDTFTKFRALNQPKNMLTTNEFTRLEKLKEELRNLRKEKTIKEITNLMHEVVKGKEVRVDMNPDDLNDLLFVMRQNHKKILEIRKNKADEKDSTSNSF